MKWKFNIPNMLSVVRLAVVPLFVYYFLNHNFFISIILLIVSSVSDFLDGQIARRFNQITDLGKVLDPVADKITLLAVVLCMWMEYGDKISGLPILFAVMILKEVIMCVGGVFLFANKKRTPQAQWYGKVATFVFYCVMTVIVLLEIMKINFSGFYNLIFIFVLISALLMVFSFFKYVNLVYKLYYKETVENKLQSKSK